MKNLFGIIIASLLICLASCQEKESDPKEAPSNAMLAALQNLSEHDLDGYLAHAYLAEDDDSIHINLLKQAITQQLQRQEQMKGTVSGYDVIDVRFVNDSICTVLYQYAFSDSTKEVCSQKMVLIDGDWKIKIRN